MKNPTHSFRLIILALAGFLAPALADESSRFVVPCYECSEQERAHKAIVAIHSGDVFVIDAYSGAIQGFRVVLTFEDEQPTSKAIKTASRFQTTSELKESYALWAQNQRQLNASSITLPQDFRVKSVAGAILDPSFTGTSIEDHLKQLPVFKQSKAAFLALAKVSQNNGMAAAALSTLSDPFTVNIGYPDGSSQSVKLGLRYDAFSNNADWEIEAAKDERTAEGNPVPVEARSFRTLQVQSDDSGAILEWVDYAREAGVEVVGSMKSPVGLICENDSPLQVRCRLIQ